MDLQQACNLIAAQVHIDAAQLYQYAMSDTLGGYHIDESQRRWPMGSLWGVEGQILYALVRILKPRRVVQIGGWVGCSAMHLALACKDNGSGQVVSIDNGSEGAAHGSLITDDLNVIDLKIWVEMPGNKIDTTQTYGAECCDVTILNIKDKPELMFCAAKNLFKAMVS